MTEIYNDSDPDCNHIWKFKRQTTDQDGNVLTYMEKCMVCTGYREYAT